MEPKIKKTKISAKPMKRTVTIEAGVPLPAARCARVYNFGDMKVGDSFALPGGSKQANSVSSCVRYWRESHPKQKFAIRQAKGEYRCWRVK
jgi:hypothetical protein